MFNDVESKNIFVWTMQIEVKILRLTNEAAMEKVHVVWWVPRCIRARRATNKVMQSLVSTTEANRNNFKILWKKSTS